ncbi:glycosyltransferase [Mesorhizobium sp. M0243]|uniref:glycosyltransferase n=1 Tax=Mesorhizobium sp. M0243 TaxID=2956925 RepID=UPI0033393E5B
MTKTLADTFAARETVYVNCGHAMCCKSTRLDIPALIDWLGPDRSMHSDLVGLFACSDCKGGTPRPAVPLSMGGSSLNASAHTDQERFRTFTPSHYLPKENATKQGHLDMPLAEPANNGLRVSVLCQTFNHASFIDQALSSIVMQKTTFPFEVIVHDDASTDGTTDIVRAYVAKYPGMVSAVIQKTNLYSFGVRGMVAKFLLPLARGRYWIVCDGDDYFTDEHKLEKQVRFLDERPECSVCFHPVQFRFDDDSEPASQYPQDGSVARFDLETLLSQNFIPANSAMFRRRSYRNLSVSNMLPNDWYLSLFHALYGKIGFIPEVMAAYRRHSGGIWWQGSRDRYAHLRAHGLCIVVMLHEVLKLCPDHPSRQQIIKDQINALEKEIVAFFGIRGRLCIDAVLRW